MMTLAGHCLCGAVQVQLAREPQVVNMCHCADCQRRSGSPFGMAPWLLEADMTITGETCEFAHDSDKGRTLIRRFCPTCGSTICFTAAINPGLIAIPAGLFADPNTPPPLRSVFEERRHSWVTVPDGAVRLPRGRDGQAGGRVALKAGVASSPSVRSANAALCSRQCRSVKRKLR